jgi:hypothetical protein
MAPIEVSSADAGLKENDWLATALLEEIKVASLADR